TAACARRAGGPQADLIITNADVWTGEAAHPYAQGVAVLGDRVVAVGSSAEVDRWRGPRTKVIDAGLRGVVPGFDDAHVHLLEGGEALDRNNREPASSAAATPALSPAERARIVERALQYAASLGVTSLQDMNPSAATLATYQQLAEQGKLTARIYVAPPETGWRDQAVLGIRRAFGSPFLRYGAVQGDADGSLGSHTAYFFQPYADDPQSRGALAGGMQPLSAVTDRLTAADAAGLQICLQAVGDAAVSAVLDLYQHIESTNGPRDRRLRIEQAQTVAPKDFDRFAALHVIASVQPYRAIADGPSVEQRLGPERAKTSDAYKTFLDHHVRLALGTGWPAAPLDPIQTLYAAVTRATLDGKHPDGWEPQERLSLADALRAYTAGSAYAEFQDQQKGTLVPGRLADLVMLSADPFGFDYSVAPDTIRNLKVDLTIVGGRIVYERAARIP
ncbi:MAG: amidohydrolase, partial [Acidobacteriota bacterium]|nr:amidohydrolase [Acidobacteriota bacterium]